MDDHRTSAPGMTAPSMEPRAPEAAFGVAVLQTGVAAGLCGMLLALLLHFVRHVAHGYDLGPVPSRESFLEGVTFAAPLRRLAALTAGGLVAGVGWWALFRFGKPLVGISASLAAGSIGIGPVCGAAAYAFRALTHWARRGLYSKALLAGHNRAPRNHARGRIRAKVCSVCRCHIWPDHLGRVDNAVELGLGDEAQLQGCLLEREVMV